MKKSLILIGIALMLFGEKMILVRDHNYSPVQPPLPNLTLNLVDEFKTTTIPIKKYLPLSLFDSFNELRPKLKRATVNILVLRVEFETDDDPSTTGNGKMDLTGFNTPDSGLFYDPPHSKIYFERQMEFLRNFYLSNSFGNQIVNFTVKPDQPTKSYQLPHNMRYYSGFDRYDQSTGFVYYNVYAQDMGLVRIMLDGIAAADEDASIDFSQFDEVVIFHAGTLLQVSFNFFRFNDLPSATIPSGALEFYTGSPYVLANAGTDTIWGAAINSEMARVDEYMVGTIGTVVHEFGHVLGLPDLYDISGWSNGVGSWDLMGTGGWVGNPSLGVPEGSIPGMLGAWCRYAMGWVQPAIINNPDTTVFIRASEIDTTQYSTADQTMIKIPISQKEFYLVENRQQDIRQKDTVVVDVEDGVIISIDYGEYDFFLPGSGILIWHIDDNVIDAAWALNTLQVNPRHKGVDLEEADGIQHFDAWWYGDSLEYYGSRYDAFFVDDSGKSNKHFGPFSKPNSDSYYGKTMLNFEIKSKPDTLMNVEIKNNIMQAGFPVNVQYNNPIQHVSYGDLDGNGDIEIVVANQNGRVYAFNHDGTQYGYYPSNQKLTSYLAIGDINNDNNEDIIFATGFQIRALSGTDLTPIAGFSFSADNDILGAPLLFDINGDGSLEIIFGSKDRRLYALDSTGNNIATFPRFFNTELLSTPCVFDQTQRQIGVLGSDGRFWIMNADSILIEHTEALHNMLTFSAPVVGDIDRDGEPEAVIINGYGTIYIFGLDTLEQWFDILIDTTFYFTPGLADLDQDGYLEIIMPNSSKTLFVTNRNGTSENNFPLDENSCIFNPLLIADFDNNGSQDITYGLECLDTLGSGTIEIINNRNKKSDYGPLFGEGGFTAPGITLDLDNDGDIELIAGTDLGRLYVWDFPGNDISWSGYMNSPKNWGIFTDTLRDIQLANKLLGTLYVYPSPVERKGRVRIFMHQSADLRVDILDLVGREIGTLSFNNSLNNEYIEAEFNFEKQANGIYIVRVEANNGDKKEVKFKKFAVLK